jgi:hypothetical protein
MIEAREGPQMGAWQCAFVNKTPFDANLSMLGVIELGCPSMQPNQSFKSSMQIIKTLGCCACFTSALVAEQMKVRLTKKKILNMFFIMFQFWI